MAKQIVQKGSTSRIEYVWIQDSTSTTGAGRTGLVYDTDDLSAYYVRAKENATVIELATQDVTGNFDSGGFVEVDAANLPGLYRFDVPDDCFATGVDKVIVMLKGAANMAPVVLEYQLVDFDPLDATRLGLTALPDVDANDAGGLITSGTGTGQLNVDSGNLAGSVNSVTEPVSLAEGYDQYYAEVQLTRVRTGTSMDIYTVAWFKNATPLSVPSGASPTILVKRVSDGTDLIASTDLTQIGTTGKWKLEVTSAAQWVAPGDAALVEVSATIEDNLRIFLRTVSRDAPSL